MSKRVRAAVTALVLAMASAAVVTVAEKPAAGAVVTVPRPDHIVVVVEENHSGTGIIGNPDAPYITSLAADNANFTSSFALTHPSEPNYLGLVSGSTQGLTDDSCPHTYTTPNLGDAVLGAGLRFTGYSESLPSPGFTGCSSGPYVRKHNPWVNWPSVPAASNQPFTAFPTDYSTLPEVSFVVPNLVDDMHDGTVAQGDTWLRDNLGGYVDWAKTHNSLFVLTFDEDDNHAGNRIPTVFAGARVQAGTYTEQIDHYDVLRTITDAYGLAAPGNAATADPIVDVWTPPPGDQAPVPAFTSSCTNLVCAFDGSGSSDPDGSVTGWRWDFGDGGTASGAGVSHTFAAGGTYTVRLTVNDDKGAAASASKPVSVTGPASGPFVSDAFTRTSANGWGSADLGGPWTVAGAASNYDVGGGTGRIKLTSSGGANLLATSRVDTDLTTTLALDAVPAGNAAYAWVTGRRVSAGNEYDTRVTFSNSGRVNLWLVRSVAGAETALTAAATVPGLTFGAGTRLTVRMQVVGSAPTAVRARIWAAGTTEPTAWFASATDATDGLQVAGSVGFSTYVSSKVTNLPLTLAVSALSAKPTATPPPNQSPVAAFTTSCAQLSCTADAGGSSDPDGTVASYAWDFGDGASGSGQTASHAYAAAGTYPVRLTVTDNAGATNTTTRTVTVTVPDTPFVLDRFGRTVTSGWGTADTGGAWGGTAAPTFTVANNAGQLQLSTSALQSAWVGPARTAADVVTTFAPGALPAGGPIYPYVTGRRVSAGNTYDARVTLSNSGRVNLFLVKFVAGREVALTAETAVSGLTFAAGTSLTMRVRVTGTSPTSVAARIWRTGTPEPSGWQASATDSSPELQAAGTVGIRCYLSSKATNAPITLAYTAVTASAVPAA